MRAVAASRTPIARLGAATYIFPFWINGLQPVLDGRARPGRRGPSAMLALLAYLRDGVVVGHHIAHDIAMIDAACQRQFDLKLAKEFNLSRSINLRLSAEVFNVFDDQTYTIYNPALGLGRRLNGQNEAFLRTGRSWQLGLRLAF